MFYSATEAGNRLGITSGRLRKLAHKHLIGRKTSGMWVFSREDVLALEACRQKIGRPPKSEMA